MRVQHGSWTETRCGLNIADWSGIQVEEVRPDRCTECTSRFLQLESSLNERGSEIGRRALTFCGLEDTQQPWQEQECVPQSWFQDLVGFLDIKVAGFRSL